MINIETIVKVSKEDVIQAAMKELEKASVYVGVPEDTTGRPTGEMTNATLLAIHSKGSPLQKIPARPVIEPAIEAEDNKLKITKQLLQAAIKGIDGDEEEFLEGLAKAGMVAQNVCRAWFTDPRNGWPPNRPATVMRKLRKLKGKKKKKAVESYLAGGRVDTPLIDTGELRKSITYVVRED